MKINIMLDEGAFMPVKAHDADAGFDIKTPINITLLAEHYISVDTGVHIEIPYGYVGFLKAKSGLNVKYNIVGEGVIDSGYTGSIVVKLYNNGRYQHDFKRGDKIIQLVILPIPYVELELTDSFEETDRGNNGFGSTGR